ncbi:MAG: TIGR03808 family TAT-translocated repetitive protein [Hyphomicrobiales bacterium]|nr:MAG: TIGR03808 family TAT-translocated repetitive protein [Hyphomicrobiales bacterium]
MTLNRRNFLGSLGLGGAGAALGLPALGAAEATDRITLADIRGSFNANQSGLRPGAIDDQGKLLQKILNSAAEANKPVFLPPGNYFVSNIVLPSRTRLMGVPGASRLIYTGGGHFLMSENGSHIELTGLVLDGANRGLQSYAGAALRINNASHLVIENCQISGSLEIGVQIDRSQGRIERCEISGAAGECGLYGIENKGLLIAHNHVHDCANGGILVHRWKTGDDGTIISNNRIERIGSAHGGTGQWGNGINVYRADSVMIANNQVKDCAFSAIRSNSGNNVQITANQCLRSGEAAIYSEFEFNGAIITNNVIDGGARGISIANFNRNGRMAICANNLIRNIHDNPPYEDKDHLFGEGISAEAETTITGNVIENTARFGMMLGWGEYLRNVIVTSNVIRDTKTGIYVTVIEGTGPAIISQNLFSGITDGAIIGYRWQEPVTSDLIDGSSFPNLQIERNQTS